MRTLNSNKKNVMSALLVLGLLIVGSLARAGTEKFDAQMQPIVEEYLKIPKVLAADQTTGVVTAAKKLKQLAAKLDLSGVTGEHAAHYKDIPANLQNGAEKMIEATDIAAMREALKVLSKPLAMWATMSKPKGITVMYCSMAPGSWLQRGTTVSNPYYGAAMLRCGDIVAGEGATTPDKNQHHGGMH